jgi:NAD(P)H-hydrate epimerase
MILINHSVLLDVERMSQADRLTEAAGIAVNELMATAGAAVACAIEQRWSARRVTVLCGPGNNGGDGFVVARLLAASGWPVRIALLGLREHLSGAARFHADSWNSSIEPLTPDVLEGAELVVDALFGAGLSRPLDGAAKDILATVVSRHIPLVAIDVPSGLMGDTGEAVGAVPAVLTVTFFRKKPGHVLLPGRLLCGEIIVADIGTPTGILAELEPNTFENDPELWISALPRPHQGDNKYTRGHALISGGYPLTGAARLAARAAARAGAGLITIAVPEISFAIYAAALTSIMLQSLSLPGDFERLLADRRFTGLLIGPGSGVSGETRARALAMLRSGRPTVLDADAISVFQDAPQILKQTNSGPCILTPHEGEFSRLFDYSGDKLTRTRAAASSSGAIIVLKGCDTVITAPDGRAIINSNAPATLATAGAGDVLSGILLGLLAQGMEPFLAAAAAVWLHGAAATAFGPGLIAEDLADLLPGILRGLYTSENR